jgi:hypothetical protein
VVSKEGWTKGAIDKMHKIDSFFRETQRCDGIAFCSLDSFLVPQLRDADSLSASS